eukprot:883274_1
MHLARRFLSLLYSSGLTLNHAHGQSLHLSNGRHHTMASQNDQIKAGPGVSPVPPFPNRVMRQVQFGIPMINRSGSQKLARGYSREKGKFETITPNTRDVPQLRSVNGDRGHKQVIGQDVRSSQTLSGGQISGESGGFSQPDGPIRSNVDLDRNFKFSPFSRSFKPNEPKHSQGYSPVKTEQSFGSERWNSMPSNMGTGNQTGVSSNPGRAVGHWRSVDVQDIFSGGPMPTNNIQAFPVK